MFAVNIDDVLNARIEVKTLITGINKSKVTRSEDNTLLILDITERSIGTIVELVKHYQQNIRFYEQNKDGNWREFK